MSDSIVKRLVKDKETITALQNRIQELTGIIDNNIRIMNQNIMSLEPMIKDTKNTLSKEIQSIKSGFLLVYSEDREKEIHCLGSFDSKEEAYNTMKKYFKENESNTTLVFESGITENNGYIIFKNDRTIRWKIIDTLNPI